MCIGKLSYHPERTDRAGWQRAMPTITTLNLGLKTIGNIRLLMVIENYFYLRWLTEPSPNRQATSPLIMKLSVTKRCRATVVMSFEEAR